MERYLVQCRHGRKWLTQADTADLDEAHEDAELLQWQEHPSRVWDTATKRVIEKRAPMARTA